MAFLKPILTALLLTSSLFAQLVIEEVTEDTTHEAKTVTLSTDSKEKIAGHKNEWGAAFMSLAIPGSGQFYLGEKRKGAAYVTGELLMIAGIIFSEATSRRMYDNSITYAKVYAGITSNRDRDDNYWKVIGHYNDTSAYFLDQETKFRDFDSDYEGWNWEIHSDEYHRADYNEQRATANKWHSASYIFVGGVIVNHLVSFIDARISASRYNNTLLSKIDVVPLYDFTTNSTSLTIVGVF